MAKRIAAPPSTLAIEREGRVTTWTLYKKPITGTRSEQEAYERGFRAYVEDFNQGFERPLTMNYRKKTDQAAYELGYQDAKTSGVITDGRTHAKAESHPARRDAVDGAVAASTAGAKRRTASQRSEARSRRRP